MFGVEPMARTAAHRWNWGCALILFQESTRRLYAGPDAPPNDSGNVAGKHKSMNKVDASALPRTLFLIFSVYLQKAPLDEPITNSWIKNVPKATPTASTWWPPPTKFLRTYYATVKVYLESSEHIAWSNHKILAGRHFIFQMPSGLIFRGLFAFCFIMNFLLSGLVLSCYLITAVTFRPFFGLVMFHAGVATSAFQCHYKN